MWASVILEELKGLSYCDYQSLKTGLSAVILPGTTGPVPVHLLAWHFKKNNNKSHQDEV